MRLPIQAPPTIRNFSTVKVLDITAGVNPSQSGVQQNSEIQRNLKLQCDICCATPGVKCPSLCVCNK